MISAIGFLENSERVVKLKRFIPDEVVKEKLAYLRIPLVDEAPEEEEDELLQEDDKIIWATPNTEEISSLCFLVYNHGEIFRHHDTFVFSTVLDGATLANGMVALGTFEPHIFIYDGFTALPVLPQKLLEGHSAAVTGMKSTDSGSRLFSCSEDGTLREWDLEKMCSSKSTDYEMPLHAFDVLEGNVAVGTEKYLNVNGESISMDGELERVRFSGNQLYVADGNGKLTVYDIRQMGSPLLSKMAHEGGVFDLAFYNDRVATCGLDKSIRVWNGELRELADFTKEEVNYRLAYDDTGRLFCGGENGAVTEIIMDGDDKVAESPTGP